MIKLKYLTTDDSNFRVYYKDASGNLYCLQQFIKKDYQLYSCTDCGEPCLPISLADKRFSFELPPLDTITAQEVRSFLFLHNGTARYERAVV